MPNVCFLFPGQGAQFLGMGKDLWDYSDEIKKLFKTASEITGKDIETLLFDSDEAELTKTENTQISITVVNIASAIVAKSMGIIPQGCGGFSLGEYSALYLSEVLSLTDTLALVQKRGKVMNLAAKNIEDPGMTAVIGLSPQEVLSILQEKAYGKVFIANYNSPIQTVVSGKGKTLDKLEKHFEDAGAMKTVRLKVSGPFHTPFMNEAAKSFDEITKSFKFSDPTIRLYSNVTGNEIKSGKEVRELCVKQITSPVRWTDEEQAIIDDKFDTPLETGPGKVLCGLWKSFNKKIKCRPAGKLEEIKAISSQVVQ